MRECLPAIHPFACPFVNGGQSFASDQPTGSVAVRTRLGRCSRRYRRRRCRVATGMAGCYGNHHRSTTAIAVVAAEAFFSPAKPSSAIGAATLPVDVGHGRERCATDDVLSVIR